jgi:translation initiation factor 3 subunit G
MWAKFGLEKDNKPGPDRATTTVGETVYLKLSPGNKVRYDPQWFLPILLTCARAVGGIGNIGAASVEGHPFKSGRWQGRL